MFFDTALPSCSSVVCAGVAAMGAATSLLFLCILAYSVFLGHRALRARRGSVRSAADLWVHTIGQRHQAYESFGAIVGEMASRAGFPASFHLAHGRFVEELTQARAMLSALLVPETDPTRFLMGNHSAILVLDQVDAELLREAATLAHLATHSPCVNDARHTGAMERINAAEVAVHFARQGYIDAVGDYNAARATFLGTFLSNIFGFPAAHTPATAIPSGGSRA